MGIDDFPAADILNVTDLKLSPRVGTGPGMLAVPTPVQHSAWSSRQCNRAGEGNTSRTCWGGRMKLTLPTDTMVISAQHPKESVFKKNRAPRTSE